MENKQLELPLSNTTVWKKMDPVVKNEIVDIMAKMILQIVGKNNWEENNGNKPRPKNL